MTESQNFQGLSASADVVVLGAGPAGLVLANLLLAAGIDCVVLERADRSHVQTRARAGFLAPNTVRILDRHGLADGLHRNGRTHGTCEFRTGDGRFRLDYGSLGRGERHTVYPQQNLVTDLLTHYLDAGGRIHFATEALAVHDADGARPYVTTREPDGRPTRWDARYVAGCDGRHGASRRSLPTGAVRHHHDHGVSWLGLLAEAPPSLDAVGYAVHDRGFAGHMARRSRGTTCSTNAAPPPTPGPRSGSGTNSTCGWAPRSTARCAGGRSSSAASSTLRATWSNRSATARSCSPAMPRA